MEALAEASADDLIQLTSNFDANKGTFITSSATDSSSYCSVRYTSKKLIPASHPKNVFGGGSFDINRGQPLNDEFTGMIDAFTGELRHGKRLYVLTGETYEGPFIDGGIRHGDDAIVKNLYLPNYSSKESSLPVVTSKSHYYGSYENDSPKHGSLVVSSNGLGFTYHGSFKNSRPHGQNCTLAKQCGYKYEGKFFNGLFHGHGVETEAPSVGGGIYEGEFRFGVRQGYGTYTQKLKTSEKGTHKNEDENEDEDDDGLDYVFKGQWNNGMKQGEGEEVIRGSELFKGQFHMNDRHGYGSLTFISNSSDIKGKESTKQSDVSTDSNGDESMPNLGQVIIKAEGQWRAGKQLDGIHDWTLIYANGDVYTGFATNFSPSGYGVKRFANRDIYSGHWENGMRNGEGIFISANGREEYIGEWIDDKIIPVTEENKDEAIARITDFAMTLLKRDYNGDSLDHLEFNDGKEKSYHRQSEFLKKVVEQSLSLSLLHLDREVKERQNSLREFPKSWPKKKSRAKNKPPIEKDEVSQAGTELTECTADESDDEDKTDDNDLEENTKTKLITYPNGDSYLGSLCTATRQREGYGVYLSVATGSTYSGNFEEDQRHGFGILLHPLGKYSGEFCRDARHGMGTLILNDASSYYGQFENNLFHGRGTLCCKDGTIYVGEWEDGLKNGHGYETLADGRVYMGDFKDSKRHGVGSLLTKQGGSVLYNGSWLCGKYHGQGNIWKYLETSSTQNNRHSDSINKNLMNQTNSSCQKLEIIHYQGSFIDGLRHGSGKLTNTMDDTEYQGEWHKDFPTDGRWRISMNGTVYSGDAKVFDDEMAQLEITDDKDEARGELQCSSMTSSDDLSPNPLEINQLIFPKPDGFGTMRYYNGDVYVGHFKKGLRHGSGTCVYANQERWDGIWLNDKQESKQGQMVTLSNNDDSSHIGFEDVAIED